MERLFVFLTEWLSDCLTKMTPWEAKVDVKILYYPFILVSESLIQQPQKAAVNGLQILKSIRNQKGWNIGSDIHFITKSPLLPVHNYFATKSNIENRS